MTLPNIYSSKDHFLNERRHIFNTQWLLLCHESECQSIGQYLTFNIGGEPLVLIRGDDYSIRCFFNICVHRGFPLFLENSGHITEHIRCGYHGWRYNVNGQLLTQSMDCKSLQEVETKNHFGFIFIRIRDSSSSTSLDSNHLFSEFSSWNSLLLKPVRTNTFIKILPVNWKLFIENTIETDHVPSVHSNLNSLIDPIYKFETDSIVLKTVAQFTDNPSHSWTIRSYKSIVKRITQPLLKESQWVFYFLFPNTQITISPEQISYLQAFPINESSTLIRGKYLSPKTEDKAQLASQYLNLRIGKQIYSEDLALLRRMQESFYSREFKYKLKDNALDEPLLFFKSIYNAMLATADYPY